MKPKQGKLGSTDASGPFVLRFWKKSYIKSSNSSLKNNLIRTYVFDMMTSLKVKVERILGKFKFQDQIVRK